VRPVLDRVHKRACRVSIHAPARGSTDRLAKNGPMKGCFNPRTRTGCDNLTLASWMNMICFNPRTRTGCDISKCFCATINVAVSIHAPARGATCLLLVAHQTGRVSIHAPARGATFSLFLDSPRLTRFNPRTRTGCDGKA